MQESEAADIIVLIIVSTYSSFPAFLLSHVPKTHASSEPEVSTGHTGYHLGFLKQIMGSSFLYVVLFIKALLSSFNLPTICWNLLLVDNILFSSPFLFTVFVYLLLSMFVFQWDTGAMS